MSVAEVAAPSQYTNDTNAGMSELTGNINSTPNPVDIYKSALAKYGVTDARASVDNLRGQLDQKFSELNAVEPGINEKVAGTNTTEAQRQHLVVAAQSPMAGAISAITRSLDADLKNLGMDVNEANIATGYGVKGNQEKRAAILDRIKLNIELAQNDTQRKEWQTAFDEKNREFTVQHQLEQDTFNESVRHNKAAEGAQWQAARAAKANSGGGSGGGGSYSSSVGGSSGANQAPSYGYKNGKDAKNGYWFTDYNGRPISAATYAKMIGVSTNTLVRKMAASGDVGAQGALKSGKLGSAFTWT